MEHNIDVTARCAASVAALNAEFNWGLDAEQQHTYVSGLLPYLTSATDDAALRRIIAHYHADHQLVHALRESGAPLHDTAWRMWSQYAVRIAQQHARGSENDPLVDADDLAQLALEALAQALPSFRYASRFSTWAYTIIARRVQRYIRDSRAAKRAGRPASLDEDVVAVQAATDSTTVEAPAEANALVSLVTAVLSQEADERLARIFYLWAVEDQRLALIGQHVHLSTGRVSVLIEQARHLLQRDPHILAWIGIDPPDLALAPHEDAHVLPDKKNDGHIVTDDA